jgi:AcrR family transcriptional regulator
VSSPPSARVRKPAGERREQILAVATALISERGYWKLALHDVATGSEMSMPGLLHHFPSKDALLIAVLERRDEMDVASLAQRLSAAVRRVGDTGEDAGGITEGHGDPVLLTGLDGLVERNLHQREVVRLYTLLEAESLTPGHPARTYFEDRQRYTLQAITEAAAGLHPHPERLAQQLLALLDGLQIQWLRDESMDLLAAWRSASRRLLR